MRRGRGLTGYRSYIVWGCGAYEAARELHIGGSKAGLGGFQCAGPLEATGCFPVFVRFPPSSSSVFLFTAVLHIPGRLLFTPITSTSPTHGCDPSLHPLSLYVPLPASPSLLPLLRHLAIFIRFMLLSFFCGSFFVRPSVCQTLRATVTPFLAFPPSSCLHSSFLLLFTPLTNANCLLEFNSRKLALPSEHNLRGDVDRVGRPRTGLRPRLWRQPLLPSHLPLPPRALRKRRRLRRRHLFYV